MKKFTLIVIGVILISGASGNPLEFADRPFGPLKVKSGPDCTINRGNFDALLYELVVSANRTCSILYQTELKYESLGDGRGKVTGSTVRVKIEQFSNKVLLKKSLINPNIAQARKNAKEGSNILKYSNGNIQEWISGDFKVKITKSGNPIPEADNIIEYNLQEYPPTYTVNTADVNAAKINKNELELHMQVINNAESYRNILRTKSDKYAGTMAQCKEEATIRSAAGLCEEAFIAPEKTPAPGRRKSIGCPIAMTFDSSERKKLWKDLERRALKSERLDFNVDSWECSYVGPQWYYYQVGKELGFTNLEFRLMYKLGVPDQFLPQLE